ncbi:hypothetical protein [Sandarakinorhabdus limnophila]|jgi:hypothetical protein|uniref:hypothetical protein n=1 Tax=Sandarakinorhabdus limnophila TaxID=210512 RepID=UPI0003B3222B|nr:hypothetical protein [Sandarakinorhabdus limnophila]
MRLALALPLLLLAACDAAPPRVDPKGQQMRAELDTLTADYGKCVDEKVAAADVSNDPAGSIAIEAVKACRPIRNALRLKVASFDRFGHPNHSANQAEAVAEASVGVIEKELREQAVVTIVTRQNETR